MFERSQRLMVAATGALLVVGCSDVTAPAEWPEPVVQAAVSASGTVEVTNGLDGGPGSFRDAIEQANMNASIWRIRIDRIVGTIHLSSTVTYTGAQALSIDGRGVTIDASGAPFDSNGFAATGGASLTFHDLTLQNASGNGIFVDVPASEGGRLVFTLDGVTLYGHGKHGLHIDDQISPIDASGADSPANIELNVIRSRVEATGFRPDISDFDGIRVDEGGPGTLFNTIRHSVFTANAGDGIELDETGDGDVISSLAHSTFDFNGTQPQNQADVEDGFDIDENDAGSIHFRAEHVTANGNRDEGIDLDEEGTGGVYAWVDQVTTNANDNGFTITEDEINLLGGTVEVHFNNLDASFNEGDGVKLEEFGDGNLSARIVNSTMNSNGDDGIAAEQQDAGSGLLRLQKTQLDNNGDDPIDDDNVTIVIIP